MPNLCSVCFLGADSKMDKNKRLSLVQALKTKGKIASTGVEDSTRPASELSPPTSPTSHSQHPSPTRPQQNPPSPTHTPSSPPAIATVPLALVETATTPTPLDKGKGVVVVPSEDDEDSAEGQVFKRRRTTKVVTSTSSSNHVAESLREHPPSATSPPQQLALEGGVESEPTPTPAPAPELPQPVQEPLRGYLRRTAPGGPSEEARKEITAYYLGAFLACATFWRDQARAKGSELSALQALEKSVPP